MFRKLLITALVLSAWLPAVAQDNINYKIVHDRPRDVNNFVMALDVMQMDFAFNNIEGISFNLGVWGYADYHKTIGIDYAIRYGWMSLGRLGNADARRHTQVEVGAYLPLIKRDVKRNFNVTLKSTVTRGDKYETTTTQYIVVPGTQYRGVGVRGGILHYGGVLTRPRELTESGNDNYAVYGLYAGLFRSKTDNLRISTDKFGIRGYTHNVRLYIDATLTPISTFKNTNNYYFNLPVGVRMGMWVLPSLPRKEAKGIYNKGICVQIEVGVRRFDKFYTQATVSIPVARKKLKALGAEDNEPVRTNE
jgi:hypothetical protein